MLEGNPDAPVCVDCHSAHQIGTNHLSHFKEASDRSCGKCHAESLAHYRDTYHGKAMALGKPNIAPDVAACYDAMDVFVLSSRWEGLSYALLEAMDNHTRLLSVSAVQWNDGFRLDLETLGRACRSKGVLFFVDAIQQLGALSVNVETCHVDFLAADAHKWLLGPEGIAVFYCRESARPRLRLIQQGWHMFDNPWNFQRGEWEPSTSAKRFEAGSPNSMGQAALHASLNLLLKTGTEQVSGQILQNTEFLIKALSHIPGVQITSAREPERRSGIVSFSHDGSPSKSLNTRLAESGVTCAVRGNSIRLSPHFYQDETDLAEFIQILERVL